MGGCKKSHLRVYCFCVLPCRIGVHEVGVRLEEDVGDDDEVHGDDERLRPR